MLSHQTLDLKMGGFEWVALHGWGIAWLEH